MNEPTLPDDLNPAVVEALAKLIGKVTGLVPPPANCFPPEWHGALRDFYRTASEIAAANLASSPVVAPAWQDVMAERRRQITEKGHTVDDDVIYNDQGQMSWAAAGLAALASEAATDIVLGLTGGLTYDDECIGSPEPYPHDWKYKPAPPRRNLVVAAAFILAEIERIDRVATPTGDATK